MSISRSGIALPAGLAVALLAAPAWAALPPQWQRARELHGVVDKAVELFGNRPIEAIERLEGGAYRVRGGGCELVVTIVPKPQTMPGPLAFSLAPGKLSCR
jgi:hypothetical protein